MDRHSTAIPLPLTSGRHGGPSLLAPNSLMAEGTPRRLRPGEVLLPEGHRPGSLMVVRAGAVQLALTAPGGRRVVVALLGPGDVLGEESLGGLADSAEWLRGPWLRPEARAVAASTISVYDPRQLRAAIHREPAVVAWLADRLGHRIHELETRMTWSLSLCVRDHLQAVLRDLARRWGSPAAEGTVIGLPLSQGALAAMVGASRESVNRALRQLLASGAIRRRAGVTCWSRRHSRRAARSGRE
jgi:CRP/FNR family transcriptional regulator, cyclic AMP receptor protein